MSSETQVARSIHGLKPNCLSFGEILGQSFAAIAPTTIAASNIGLIVALSGNGTWLSFLIGLIGLVFVSVNINHFASRSATPGSFYSYISQGLGSTAGVMCGWCLMWAYLLTGMSVLCGFANFSAIFLAQIGIESPGVEFFILALGAGISWYAAYKDVQLSAVAMLLLEGVSIGLITILCLIIWSHKGFMLDMSQLTLKGVTPGSVASGLVLVLFGFSGFESATSLGDEAKDPLKTIPRAMMGSTILSGLFFMITAYIEILGFEGTGVSITKSETPLTFLSQQVGLSWLGQLVAVGALFSFFACVLGTINPAARIVFIMSRYGLFPPTLGAAHPGNRTPHNAITLCSLLLFVVPAVMAFKGIKLFDSMGYLGALSSFGFVVAYILISVAAPVYLRKIGKLQTSHIIFSVVAILFMVIPVIGSVGIPGNALFPVPEHPYDIFPYLFLLYLVLTSVWFALQRVRFPGIAQRMQAHIEEVHSQFATVEEQQ